MKASRYRVLLSSVAFCFTMILFGCASDDTTPATLERKDPNPTAIGVENGPKVAAIIGPDGGKLMSYDSLAELIVPPGSLSENTTLSIQEITNLAPGSVGKAYRLLPSGEIFKKEVSLAIRYDEEELSITQPEFLGVAFQDDAGIWEEIAATNEAGSHVITAKTAHFTDFTVFEILRIYPPTAILKTGQSIYLSFGFNDELRLAEDNKQLHDLYLAIVGDKPLKWFANGKENGNTEMGLITYDPKSVQDAKYTAPAVAPKGNPVDVSAEINLPYTTDDIHYDKVIVNSKIKIIGNTYKIEIESSQKITPNDDEYIFYDHASYILSIVPDDKQAGALHGIFTEVQNKAATFKTIKGACTTVASAGTGPINFSVNDFYPIVGAVSSQLIRVDCFNSQLATSPSFTDNCVTPPDTSPGFQMPGISGSIQFEHNGKPQKYYTGFGEYEIYFTITPLQ